MIQMNSSTKQKQTHKENFWLPEVKGRGGLIRSLGVAKPEEKHVDGQNRNGPQMGASLQQSLERFKD